MFEVLQQRGHHPLFSTAGCRALEAAALATAPAHALMARAGLAVARLALAIAPHARRVWIACGPGNNGGDGLVAARHLASAGLEVHLSLLTGARTPPSDAQWALDALRAAPPTGLHLHTTPSPPPGCDLFIDALLGLGVQRAPQGLLAEAVAALNGAGAPVLSVDLPSGLQGDTGIPCPSADGHPGAVVRADHTLCLLSLKPGLFTAQGRDFAGRIWLDTLGIDAPTGDIGWLIAPGQARQGSPIELGSAHRLHASHKGSYGQVLVVGGAAHMTGAAELAAGAALAAGAGKVFVKTPGASHPLSALRRPELMQWPSGDAGRLGPDTHWQDLTLVAGCGAGTSLEVDDLLGTLLLYAPRLVLDADGLNTLAGQTAARQMLQGRRARGLHTILTPHPLEAARLLGRTTAEVQGDRLSAARALSAMFDCTVVLKGSGTVIASPQAPLHINGSGNAALAGAGTGDVLAGWIGGRWAQPAQGAPGATPAPHDVATWGVARHGEAAEGARAPLRAADLIERMHALQAPPP